MADCKHCAALRAEVERLNAHIVTQRGQIDKLIMESVALTARVKELETALNGVLWMAEEWFKHGGDETTFADDYEAKLEAARATITQETRYE